MSYFERDSRIDDDVIRNLEKKLHFCMQVMFDAGLINDKFSGGRASPDDCPNTDIFKDAAEVREEFTQQ